MSGSELSSNAHTGRGTLAPSVRNPSGITKRPAIAEQQVRSRRNSPHQRRGRPLARISARGNSRTTALDWKPIILTSADLAGLAFVRSPPAASPGVLEPTTRPVVPDARAGNPMLCGRGRFWSALDPGSVGDGHQKRECREPGSAAAHVSPTSPARAP